MVGRPPATTREQIEDAAFALFAAQGFDDTTVDEIARAAGIGRRTFFRYFRSKNDVVWGDFDGGLDRLRADLRAADASVPWPDALRRAVVDFNALRPEQVATHRARMELILHVPALQAYATLMYARWREVVAEFVAVRTRAAPDDFGPRLVGHTALAAAVAAYEQWLEDPSASLPDLLETGLHLLPGPNVLEGSGGG